MPKPSSGSTPPAPPGAGAPALPGAASPAASVEIPRWKAEDLLGTSDEVQIIHGGQTYKLRRTKAGKLILIK